MVALTAEQANGPEQVRKLFVTITIVLQANNLQKKKQLQAQMDVQTAP